MDISIKFGGLLVPCVVFYGLYSQSTNGQNSRTAYGHINLTTQGHVNLQEHFHQILSAGANML